MNTLPSMTTNSISLDDASQMSDAQALAAFASKGDPAAFAMLTQRYQRMVLATCARVTRSQADAEDAAQETFLKLARKAGEIHGSAAAWLHAAAMGTSLDLLRRKRAMQRAEYKAKDLSKLSDAAGGDEAGDTATSILWNELEPALDDALATLSDEDRDAVVGHYLAGRQQKQLADEAGVSAGTMSRRIERGLAALATQLRAKGFGAIAIGALAGALSHGASATQASAAVAAASAKAALSQAALSQTPLAAQAAGTVGTTKAASGLSMKTIALLAIAGAALAGGVGALLLVNTGNTAQQALSGQQAMLMQPTANWPSHPMIDQRVGGKLSLDTTVKVDAKQLVHSTEINSIGPQARIVFDRLETSMQGEETLIRVRVSQVDAGAVDATGPTIGATGVIRGTIREDGLANLRLKLDGIEEELQPFVGRLVDDGKSASGDSLLPLDARLVGTWASIPNWNLAVSSDAISLVSGDFFVEKYRILSWEAHEGYARVETLCTTNVNQVPMIGSRVKFVLQDTGTEMLLARHTLESKKLGEFPALTTQSNGATMTEIAAGGEGVKIARFRKEAR